MKKGKSSTINLPYDTREFFPPEYEIVSKRDILIRNNLWGEIKEKTFVETGTFFGHGVTAAIWNGCTDIHSIEINPYYFTQACFRLMALAMYNRDRATSEIYNEESFFSVVFGGGLRVSLYRGDTVDILPVVLSRVSEPAFLWLDAHWSGDATLIEGVLDENSPPEVKCPIIKELSIIKKHAIKNHTIAIDDYRQVCESAGSFDNIKKEILKINSEYSVRTKDKPSDDDKIIIAETN